MTKKQVDAEQSEVLAGELPLKGIVELFKLHRKLKVPGGVTVDFAELSTQDKTDVEERFDKAA